MPTKTAPAAEEAVEGAPARKRGKKVILLMLVALLVAGGAAAYLLLGGSGKGAAKPQPGAVLKLDPINLNLQEGHYLKLGLALQLTKDAGETPDGSKALDIAIMTFSNRSMAELGSKTAREKAKAGLVKALHDAYDGTVMDVYFTEFVMQ